MLYILYSKYNNIYIETPACSKSSHHGDTLRVPDSCHGVVVHCYRERDYSLPDSHKVVDVEGVAVGKTLRTPAGEKEFSPVESRTMGRHLLKTTGKTPGARLAGHQGESGDIVPVVGG